MSGIDFAAANAVVTGAGSGIGRSIAEELARHGARVLIADINSTAAEEVAAGIRNGGGSASARAVDVADLESVRSLADAAFSLFGRVDILCNNAGVTWSTTRAVWDATPDDFRWLMDVNYFGVVHGILAFVPCMRAQPGHKHLVNTSSMVTLSATPGHGPYTASKHAIDGLSEVLREELRDAGDDFGVTLLHPGVISTGIRRNSAAVRSGGVSAEDGEDYRSSRSLDLPHHRPKDPADVGAQVLEAIRADDPYCLTHDAPVAEIDERRDRWIAGYRGS